MAAPAQPQPALFFRGANRISMPPACTFKAHELRRLFDLLQAKANEAGALQVASLQRTVHQTDDDFAQLEDEVLQSMALSVRVRGSNGQWTGGTDPNILADQNLPEVVRQVEYLSGFLFHNRTKTDPNNWFTLMLDFNQSAIFDISQTTVQGGGNNSNFTVSGTNQTWVNGVDQEVKDFFATRKNLRGWLYLRLIYDLFVFLIGVPLSLYTVLNVDRVVRRELAMPESVLVALYVYLVLVSLLVFRFTFNYLKWAFPRMEVEDRRTRGLTLHKIVLGLLATAIFTTTVKGFLKLTGIKIFQ